MRGFLLKGFFRCKALTPGGHNQCWSRKRRKLLPLPALKRRKVIDLDVEASFVEPDVALNVDANPLALHEEDEVGMQSEQSRGNESEEGGIFRAKEVLDVQSAPLEREQLNLYPYVTKPLKNMELGFSHCFLGGTLAFHGIAEDSQILCFFLHAILKVECIVGV